MNLYCRLCKIFCVVCLCFGFLSIAAQPSACPANIDFEFGNFTNWECYTGNVVATSGQNTINWNTVTNVPTPGRIEIIGPGDASLDPIGNFPRHCPNSSGYSIKLGNDAGGHEAEGVSYTYSIPASAIKFSILYNYAIVLQTPGHLPEQQPRFRARVIDVATNTEINCVSFDFTASGSLPGFQSAGGAVYKDWTPVSVDLSSFAGRTVRLEFFTSDCTFQQHFGYAYIDVNSDCSGTIKGSTYCQGDSIITLTAPYGFQTYEWYADNTFGQIMNVGQQLFLNINTNVGSIFPVVVKPYPGFGCLDTLYAVIARAAKPVSVAGIDRTVCNKQSTQLGGPPNSNYTYAWSPANLLVNSTVSDAQTVIPLNTPASFVVKTTDVSSGCFSYDTVLVTPVLLDTASSFSGKLIYCPKDPIQVTLTVDNAAAQVQWLEENRLLSGSTNRVFQPGTVGTYRAQVSQYGCIDTTRAHTIRYAAVPKTGFTVDNELQCINQPIQFTNTTSIQGNEALTYLWRFSDGTSLQTINAQKAFASTGTQMATLIATSATNCADSVQHTVAVTSYCKPLLPSAFTPNADGRNERFTPYLPGAKSLKRFAIYNRYGNAVFFTTRKGEGWNGTYKGVAVEAGVFVWMLEYTDDNNKAAVAQGTVVLIR